VPKSEFVVVVAVGKAEADVVAKNVMRSSLLSFFLIYLR
jgi:hypothetical protein